MLVDGQAVPVLRANLAFSAVFLSPGQHPIERRYQPNGVRYGVWCSLLFAVVLGWGTYKRWWLQQQ